jgi:hypothetical protein
MFGRGSVRRRLAVDSIARTARGVALVLVAAVALAAHAPNRAPDEGALDNDVFLPTSRQADELLARGDAALAPAGDTAPGRIDRTRARLTAFEAWRSALTATSSGDAVSPAGAWRARGTVGVELAVLGRLAALAPEDRAAWTARFAELAAGELAAAGRDPARLADVERRNPVTPVAVVAALRACDIELERGDPTAARTWCERAARHAELLAPHAATATHSAAIAARAKVLDQLTSPPREAPASWTNATSLRYSGRVALVDESQRIPRRLRSELPGPPRGLSPGLAVLRDDRLAVQTPDRLIVLPARGRRIDSVFEPSALLGDDVYVPPPSSRFGEDRDWPLLPVTAGDSIVVVHGRARMGGNDANALMCIRPPSPSPDPADTSGPPKTAALPLPSLDWAVVGNLRVRDDGTTVADPLLADLETAELQPGPLVVGARVFVQAREYESDIRAWLLCFDRSTGECLWTRRLAQGSGLYPREFREAAASLRSATPAQPLVDAGDGRVFAGTNLGAGVLVDAVDGRIVWSYENRRRTSGTPGWNTNWRPSVAADEHGAVLLWAPVDSDHQYGLRAAPAGGADDGPSLFAPREVDEAVAFVGGDTREAVVLSRAGARRTISAWRIDDGARFDAPYLGREEAFGGAGAVSDQRVIAATDRGVYLVDRAREMFLLDYEPFPGGMSPLGGSVVAHGSNVLVVGERTVWTFFAE